MSDQEIKLFKEMKQL